MLSYCGGLGNKICNYYFGILWGSKKERFIINILVYCGGLGNKGCWLTFWHTVRVQERKVVNQQTQNFVDLKIGLCLMILPTLGTICSILFEKGYFISCKWQQKSAESAIFFSQRCPFCGKLASYKRKICSPQFLVRSVLFHNYTLRENTMTENVILCHSLAISC